MKLQRYDLIGQNEREIGEYERGNYVLYTDHLEAVEQARAAREPAKPERQASEIEKRAAWALLTDISPELHRLSRDDCGHVDAVLVLVDLCRQYIEAYDYAKSIGAIE